jgi:hypothetical protein
MKEPKGCPATVMITTRRRAVARRRSRISQPMVRSTTHLRLTTWAAGQVAALDDNLQGDADGLPDPAGQRLPVVPLSARNFSG